MPILTGDDFEPGWLFRNGHINTLGPYFLSKPKLPPYRRERIRTVDGDFIDLDRISRSSNSLCILCHGLEGSSYSNYITLFANYLSSKEMDIMAINYRGCSGEPNLQVTSYNSGTTGDLHDVVQYAGANYQNIYLVGFSLGGNLILKYLGEKKYVLDTRIRAAIAISTPVHLSDASKALLKSENVLYQLKFLYSLFSKIRAKNKNFPDQISMKPWWKIRNLYDFDEYYTAPLFGYSSAEDYYAKNQCIQWLEHIRVPSLIINALDDPFLGDLCYPFDEAEGSEIVSLCAPKYGGHVGFSKNGVERDWILEKTWKFLTNAG